MANFRSAYYQKIGFHGVEVKASLDEILDRDPIDVDRLAVFCLQYGTPAADRLVVWKLLLGVTPNSGSAAEYVADQLAEHYDDLVRAAALLPPDPAALDPTPAQTSPLRHRATSPASLIDPITEVPVAVGALSSGMRCLSAGGGGGDSGGLVCPVAVASPLSPVEVGRCVAMYLLQQSGGQQLYSLSTKGHDVLALKCAAFAKFTTDRPDCFWLFVFFCRRMRMVYPGESGLYLGQMLQILKLEDPDLHKQISALNKASLDRLTRSWFKECYFRTFPPSLLGNLLDVLASDTSGIYTVLGLSVMMIFKYQVTKALRGRSQDDAVLFLCAPRPQMVEQNWERILKHALQLRKKHITILLETMVP